MSDKQNKGEPFPGTVEERPDDAHPGTPLGGFADHDTADADTQPQPETAENQPAEPPPTDPGGGVLEGGKTKP